MRMRGAPLGMQRVGEEGRVRRKSFVRQQKNERDLRSTLTMLAQVLATTLCDPHTTCQSVFTRRFSSPCRLFLQILLH